MTYVKKQQRNNTRNLLIELAKAGGELTLIFSAPGSAPNFMKPYMLSEHEVDRERFDRAIQRLKKKEMIGISENNDSVTLHLTEKGEKKALRFSVDEMKLVRPEKWDGKWRLVMFDIPDEKKVARNVFKQKLDNLGFITIQKSVYAHPYKCEDEIELLRNIYEIRPFVKIITANHFEGEEKYLSRFGLGR